MIPGPSVLRRGALELALVAAFAVLAALETGLWWGLSTHLYAGPDVVQDAWIVHWISGHLLGPPDRLFDGNIYYPSRDAVLYCNPLLGPSSVALPLRALTANPVLLYNAALLATLTLSSWGFYRLALHLFGDPGAALLAGVAGPYTAHAAAHLGHLDQMTTAGFPWVLLALIRLLEGGGTAWAVLLGLAFPFQAGTSGYHAWSVLLLCLIVAAWGWRALRDPPVLGRVALAAAIAVLLLSPYVLGFLRLRAESGFRHEATAAYSVDLGSGWMVTPSWLWKRVFGRAAAGSTPVFPGLTVVALAAVALLRRRDRTALLLMSVFAVFYALALGPELRLFGWSLGPAPFALLRRVPTLDAVRHPGSFVLPAMVAASLLAAGGAATLARGRRGALALLLAAALLETARDLPRREALTRPLPDLYRRLAELPPGAMLELPFHDVEWQWWSIQHGRPIANGACGSFAPARYYDLWQRVQQEWRRVQPQGLDAAVSTAVLKAHYPIRYVVVHAEAHPATRAQVAAAPASFERVLETAGGDRVYRLRRGGTGRRLRRAFRDDQLRAGPVRATLTGPAGARLRVSLAGSVIAEEALSPTPRTAAWTVPGRLVRRGSNLLVLEQVGGEGEMTLVEIEGAGP